MVARAAAVMLDRLRHRGKSKFSTFMLSLPVYRLVTEPGRLRASRQSNRETTGSNDRQITRK